MTRAARTAAQIGLLALAGCSELCGMAVGGMAADIPCPTPTSDHGSTQMPSMQL